MKEMLSAAHFMSQHNIKYMISKKKTSPDHNMDFK